MSIISDSFKKKDECHFLVKLSFEGLNKRYSTIDTDNMKSVSQGEELVVNGSMEIDNNWDVYGLPASTGRSSDQALDGMHSWEVITSGSVAGIQQTGIPTEEGFTYEYSVWIYPLSSLTPFGISRTDGLGQNSVVVKSKSLSEVGVWQNIYGEYTETTSGPSSAIRVFNSVTQTYYVDNVSVRKKIKNNPQLFEDKIINISRITTPFDFRNFKYGYGSVSVLISNLNNRLQDEETRRRLDGQSGEVFIYNEDLQWNDISERGKIFSGVFQKKYHDSSTYKFDIIDSSESKFLKIPKHSISDDTWPSHRKNSNGQGSISGNAETLLFGNWSSGIPLEPVDIDNFKYLISSGNIESETLDFSGGTELIWAASGTTIDASSGITVTNTINGIGSIVTQMEFSSDHTSSEPLSCSIEGIKDTTGLYSGTTNLIEHPADIVYYLMDNFSTLETNKIDVQSIKTMRSILPGIKMTAIINDFTQSNSVIDRILSECNCAKITKLGGKIGIMTPDLYSPPIARISRDDQDILSNNIQITKTDYNIITNRLKVNYKFNPTTKKYEGSLIRDKSNSLVCEYSFFEYGEQPERIINYPDVHSEQIAYYLSSRYLSFKSHRHDIVNIDVGYEKGFDIIEGDVVLLTLLEGSSRDGNGYINERFICFQKTYKINAIGLTLWRISTNINYGGIVSTGDSDGDASDADVLFGGEEALFGGDTTTW